VLKSRVYLHMHHTKESLLCCHRMLRHVLHSSLMFALFTNLQAHTTFC
jgi:hypothetical protein